MAKNEIAVLFRWPKLPVIVLRAEGLTSAFDRKQLLKILNSIQGSSSSPDAKIIDSTGSEFWFDRPHKYLAPGFPFQRWTKKRLIVQFNEARRQQYLPKSLQNFRLERIVRDIAVLLNSPDDP